MIAFYWKILLKSTIKWRNHSYILKIKKFEDNRSPQIYLQYKQDIDIFVVDLDKWIKSCLWKCKETRGIEMLYENNKDRIEESCHLITG